MQRFSAWCFAHRLGFALFMALIAACSFALAFVVEPMLFFVGMSFLGVGLLQGCFAYFFLPGRLRAECTIPRKTVPTAPTDPNSN